MRAADPVTAVEDFGQKSFSYCLFLLLALLRPSIVRQPNPLEFLALANSFQNRLVFRVVSLLDFPCRWTRGRTGLDSESTSDTETISGLHPVFLERTLSLRTSHTSPRVQTPCLEITRKSKSRRQVGHGNGQNRSPDKFFFKTAVNVVFN